MTPPAITIAGTGYAVPERRVPSSEIEADLGRPEGWIARRTGIERRPIAAEDEATSDLSITSARRALEAAGIDASELGLILLATSTPDHLLPPTAPLVAHQLGVRCGAVDVTGACSGFLYALSLAEPFCAAHRRPVLVIGTNVLSRRINPDDAATRALFADGSGAAVLTPGGERSGPYGLYLGSDGAGYERIQIPAGGSREPFDETSAEENAHRIQMKRGPAFFRKAVDAMERTALRALDAAGTSPDEVDAWIPHQANRRITMEVGTRLGIPTERTVDIIGEYGNSSAATIPLALALAVEEGRIARDDTLLLTAVGAGMVEAGAVFSW